MYHVLVFSIASPWRSRGKRHVSYSSKNMLERPCTRCLAMLEQLVTMKWAEKQKMADRERSPVECSTLPESVGNRRVMAFFNKAWKGSLTRTTDLKSVSSIICPISAQQKASGKHLPKLWVIIVHLSNKRNFLFLNIQAPVGMLLSFLSSWSMPRKPEEVVRFGNQFQLRKMLFSV